jgi:hypothetical protein
MYPRTLVLCAALAASALTVSPMTATAQETTKQTISAVTEDYSFEGLLPAMSPEGISTTRDMAAWYLNAAQSFKTRAAEIQKKIDLQREAKKAEIKALEARAKAAATVKDQAAKKKLENIAKEQKLELEILDSVKKLSENEASIADQYESTGKTFQSLADAYDTLNKKRESALKEYEKTVQAAAEEDRPAPMPAVNYDLNQKALKALADAGKNLKQLGERMEKVAKARQDLLQNWKKKVAPFDKD